MTSRRTKLVTALLCALALGLGGSSASLAQPESVFVVAAEGEALTLTAHLAGDVPSYLVASNIFNGLVKLDYDFNPVPDLATDWEVSDDGLLYTFNLDPDASWHDGEPVTADDVVFTIDVLSEHHARRSTWLPFVTDVVATDDHTVEFRLDAPFAPLMTILGSPVNSGALIIPQHVWGDGQDIAEHPANAAPIGSGPFVFSEWVRGSHVEMVRNEDYFKEGLPGVDRLIVQFLPDEAARTLAFESGEVDFMHQFIVPLADLERLSADDRFQIIDSGAEAIGPLELLLFNLRHEHLGRTEVRQAIAYGLDREALREFAAFGAGGPAHSHLHSGLTRFHTSEHDVYEHDLDLANQMLDDAGLTRDADGTRFSVRLAVTPGRAYEPRAAEVLVDQLSQMGIAAALETSDRVTFIDTVFVNSDFDLALQTLTSGPDPTISVSPRYHTRQQLPQPFVNTMGFSNTELDEIIDTEFQVVDEAERRTLWVRAQAILMEELPILPLFEVPITQGASAGFGDVVTDPQSYIENRELVHPLAEGETPEPVVGPASTEQAGATPTDAVAGGDPSASAAPADASSPGTDAGDDAAATEETSAGGGASAALWIVGLLVLAVVGVGLLMRRQRREPE